MLYERWRWTLLYRYGKSAGELSMRLSRYARMRAASVEPLSLLMTVERIGVIRFRSGASPWLRDLARCPSFQDVGLAIPYPRHRIIKPNVAHSVCVRRA